MANDHNTALAQDILRGGGEISKYMGETEWPRAKIYYLARRAHLPIIKVGKTLVARKSELDAFLRHGGRQPVESANRGQRRR